MRAFWTAVFALALLTGAAGANQPVKAFDELMGRDWSLLPEAERQRFIYTGIGGLERQGVFVLRSPREYIEAMDAMLREPSFQNEPLDNIFVFCVYDGEPQAREAIDRIRAQAVQPEGA